MKFAIASPQASDLATLTPSSELMTLPATNLLTVHAFEVWRTTGEVESLVIDLGTEATVRLGWLGYTNAIATATIRWRAAKLEAELTSAPVFDSGVVPHWPDPNLADWARTHAFLWLDGPLACRWWRIDIDNTGSADGYYQAARLYLSDPTQFSRGQQYGWTLGWTDLSTKRRSRSGAAFVNPRGKFRTAQLTVRGISEQEIFERAGAIDRLRGTSGDVLLLPNPDNPERLMDQTLYATQQSLPPISSQVLDLWRKPYAFEEIEAP